MRGEGTWPTRKAMPLDPCRPRLLIRGGKLPAKLLKNGAGCGGVRRGWQTRREVTSDDGKTVNYDDDAKATFRIRSGRWRAIRARHLRRFKDRVEGSVGFGFGVPLPSHLEAAGTPRPAVRPRRVAVGFG